MSYKLELTIDKPDIFSQQVNGLFSVL